MNLMFLVCLTVVWVGVACAEPPLWPEYFSQSMAVNFIDLNTTGSYWYDSELNAERYDFSNGNTKTGCGSIHRINTPCTNLIRNGWLYMIFPEKSLCCKLYEANPIPRTWLQNYTYKGQETIDDILFNIWDNGINDSAEELFYTEVDDQQRPRRLVSDSRIFLDYWLNSFNATKPKANLFDIPAYCEKRCWDRFESEEDYKILQRELMKIHVGISKEQKFQKYSLLRE